MRYIPSFLKDNYDKSPIWTRNIFATGYGILKTYKERNKKFYEILNFLEESQWWSKEKIEEYQNLQLRKIIKHSAENVPYYKKLFYDYSINPSQIQNKEDLKQIPTLKKEDIKKNYRDMISIKSKLSKLIPESTSGTTGKPLTVYWNPRDHIWSCVTTHIITKKMGYDYKKDWLAIFNGYKILPSNYQGNTKWIIDYYNKKLHLSAFHMNKKTAKNYFYILQRKRIKYLMGYPSIIGLFAKLLVESNTRINLNSVMLTSEPIYDWQIFNIKKAFNCKIINSYGQAERVVSGYSCEDSLNIHLFDEICVPEFLESKYHGEKRMIATSLINYSMPLIRYELNDITSEIINIKCCENNHTTIAPVKTKNEDYIISREGNYISASLLTFPFKKAIGIVESQIVQENEELLCVNIVKSNKFTKKYEDNLLDDLRKIVGYSFKIQFNYVDNIPRTNNGKFKFVISAINKF